MTAEQLQILAVLGATMALFLWGRWRHDVVALAALLASVFLGLVPSASAFAGFGHPAVVTVACVLILSWGLQSTGAVDALARRVLPASSGPVMTLAALTGLGALLSAFMNNVGAMALLMPLGLQLADRLGWSPGRVLMPLSFGTILGGMTTLIGTPPNLIVSAFRGETGAGSFGMFDFSAVGGGVALAGLVFLVLLGWRLVPVREREGAEGFDSGTYLTEARIGDKSGAIGLSVAELESALQEADAQVVGLVRQQVRVTAPMPSRRLEAGDVLVLESEPEALGSVFSTLGLVPEEPDGEAPVRPADDAEGSAGKSADGEVVLRELAIMPGSPLIGRSARRVGLRARFGINLVALSRQGRQTIRRLRSTGLKAGDLLLLRGDDAAIGAFAAEFGCVPLAPRTISIPDRRKAWTGAAIMMLAIAGAAFGLVPAAISFAAGVLAFMALRVIPLRSVYQAVDFPVVVLLAALIPVAVAMEHTGVADLLARTLLETVADGRPVLALAIILVVTMTLSDFMNNAATAAVMCPIAISTALQLECNPDAFLMAVAVGASCAFLTPIGHQNNTLILGPGGFRFSDYWRLGLPMEIVVVAVAIPGLLFFWPL